MDTMNQEEKTGPTDESFDQWVSSLRDRLKSADLDQGARRLRTLQKDMMGGYSLPPAHDERWFR